MNNYHAIIVFLLKCYWAMVMVYIIWGRGSSRATLHSHSLLHEIYLVCCGGSIVSCKFLMT